MFTLRFSSLAAGSLLLLSACAQPESAPAARFEPYTVPVVLSLDRPYTEAEFSAAMRVLHAGERIVTTTGLSPTERRTRIETLIAAQQGTIHAAHTEQVLRSRLIREVLLPEAASPERDRAIEQSAARLVALGHPDAILMGRVVAALPSWQGGEDAARATLAAAELRETTLAARCPEGGCGATAFAAHPEAAAVATEGSRQQSAARAQLENVAR